MIPLTKPTDETAEVRIFHIAPVENVERIIQSGGLFSSHELMKRGIKPRSIAFEHLQQRRENTEINLSAGGNLHDYIPWGFAARPPMLYSAARGALTGVRQEEIVHLVSTVGRVQKAGLICLFCDGHPLTALSKFQDDLKMLPALLDWEALSSQWWNNTEDDPDRKRRRQAEFLIRDFAPWSIVRVIGVKTEAVKSRLQDALLDADIEVRVIPEWYY